MDNDIVKRLVVVRAARRPRGARVHRDLARRRRRLPPRLRGGSARVSERASTARRPPGPTPSPRRRDASPRRPRAAGHRGDATPARRRSRPTDPRTSSAPRSPAGSSRRSSSSASEPTDMAISTEQMRAARRPRRRRPRSARRSRRSASAPSCSSARRSSSPRPRSPRRSPSSARAPASAIAAGDLRRRRPAVRPERLRLARVVRAVPGTATTVLLGLLHRRRASCSCSARSPASWPRARSRRAPRRRREHGDRRGEAIKETVQSEHPERTI